MAAGDDDRPVERSARKPLEKKDRLSSATTELLANNVPKRPKSVDPRFDPLYGSFNKTHFSHEYKFLEEQREAEDRARRVRIKQLNVVIRRLRVEAEAKSKDELDEYDWSEAEQEVFLSGLEETDVAARRSALRELARLKSTPLETLQQEVQSLQRESALYRSTSGDSKAKRRVDDVKKRAMKEEANAVKSGAKKRPFFLKRRELKERVEADKFDHLHEKGGKQLVDKYLHRKSARGYNPRHGNSTTRE